jgi:glutathione-regulated potassium-efflux system protein KefB
VNIEYLTDIVILLSAAVVAVLLFQSLGPGAMTRFLVAGMVLGPSGMWFFRDYNEIAHC